MKVVELPSTGGRNVPVVANDILYSSGSSPYVLTGFSGSVQPIIKVQSETKVVAVDFGRFVSKGTVFSDGVSTSGVLS